MLIDQVRRRSGHIELRYLTKSYFPSRGGIFSQTPWIWDGLGLANKMWHIVQFLSPVLKRTCMFLSCLLECYCYMNKSELSCCRGPGGENQDTHAASLWVTRLVSDAILDPAAPGHPPTGGRLKNGWEKTYRRTTELSPDHIAEL